MTTQQDLAALAAEYHKALPERIRTYLHDRGIPDPIIDQRLLGWNGLRITIPIFNREGQLVSFKLAKDPEDKRPGAKMLASPGSHVELYGWDVVLSHPARLIICEGEFDRLVLEAQGFPAVTSTGGAKVFRSEWAKEFLAIPEVYLCFDRDEAGREGALKIARLLSEAKLAELPEEVGQGGDVTDFFVRLKRTREDFEQLLVAARPVPAQSPRPSDLLQRVLEAIPDSPGRQRIERLKRDLPIVDLIRRYLPLQGDRSPLMGRCPFHEDKTPSLAVYPDTGTFYCYGCGKRGDIITFVREMENLGFTQALEHLELLLPPHDRKSPDAS